MFFKSARRVCNNLNFNWIKTALKTLNFFKKLIFALLNQKIDVIKKTLLKYRLTLVHWNAHIWAKIHFNIISAWSEKMKLKSGHLEPWFSVCVMILLCFFVAF